MKPRAVQLGCLLLALGAGAAESAENVVNARIVTADNRCLVLDGTSHLTLAPCGLDYPTLWILPPQGFPGPFVTDRMCLEAAAAGPAIAPCTGQESQDFRRVHDGRILASDDRCLHAAPDGVELRPCGESPAQRFRVAAWNLWTEIHGFPPDPDVSSLNVYGDAIEVGTDGTVYALVAGGPFRSVDGGQTWARLPGLSVDANALLADPFDRRRLLVQQGVGQWFVSRDGTFSWDRLAYPGGARRDLALDPTTPDRWLLSGRLPRMPLLETLDGGRNWSPLDGPPVGLAFRKAAALQGTDPGVVAVAVRGVEEDREETDEGIWITRDRGGHWERRLAGTYDSLLFAADGTLYVWGEDGLQRTRSLGLDWTLLGPGPAIVVDPNDPSRLWSAAATSPDRGDTWTLLANPQAFTFDLAVDPSDSNVLYTIGETVYRSSDGGATWQRIADGLPRPRVVTAVAAGDDQRTVWILEEGQPWRSSNGGVTWNRLGPEDHDPTFTTVALVPGSPQTVYLADSFFDPALFLSLDGGSSWRELSPGQPVEHLAISHATPSHLFAWDDRRVSRSLDGGDTWFEIDLPFDIEEAEWDPHAEDIAYLVSDDSTSTQPGLYRSLDAGASFTRILAQSLVGVATDPLAPGRVFTFSHHQLWRSDDRGASWLAPVPLPPNLGVETVVASPTSKDWVYLASRIAVHHSLDAGRSWGRLLELPGIDDTTPPLLAFAATAGDVLWVSSAALYFLRGQFHASAPLLLGDDQRFAVQVRWRDFHNRTGVGRAVDRTGDTGYFWFFRPQNVELMIKVIDGRRVNGHYWVFYGALSNVEYEITVKDRFTGMARIYTNPAGRFASRGDTTAFEAVGARSPQPPDPRSGTPATDRKAAGSPTLPLRQGRFEVAVSWRDFAGRTGIGTAAPITDDTGAFWFFAAHNEELVVKVIDGRPVNGRFWVFYGALSNVEYEITVTDTTTGKVHRYRNPLGKFGSFADTDAF